MKDTIEIIKEARKAGMQVALMMFIAFLVLSCLFGFFIHESFKTETFNVQATQTNDTGNNTIKQGGIK